MHETNHRRFDLNLLAVFDALMTERHVGRAGERLGLTQPAVSHALGRLRALTGDPLFVKHPRGVTPTAQAEALAQTVGPALAALRASLGVPRAFDPAAVRRTIVLGCSDYAELTLLPALVARLRREAPGLDLRLRAITAGDVAAAMRRREIDLALGPLIASPDPALATPLLSDRLVLVARRGHPAFATPPTVEELAALPQLLVSPQGDARGAVDAALRERGLVRRVVLSVPHFGAAPRVIETTDLVALLPWRLARSFARTAQIALHESPLALPPWVIGVAQPRETAADPCLAWLVALLRDIAAQTETEDRL